MIPSTPLLSPIAVAALSAESNPPRPRKFLAGNVPTGLRLPTFQMTSDNDFNSKGAVEQDRPGQKTNTSLTGQIGHRNKGPILDTHDTDFPEPGQSPEHTGEPMEREQNNERERLERDADQVQDADDQEPGQRQRRNQNDQKDDPLAA